MTRQNSKSKLWSALPRDTKWARREDTAWLLEELDEISNIFGSNILTLKGKK
jgi:hypothetical protein